MGNMIATFSYVATFADICSQNYSAILSRANETLSQTEKLNFEVHTDSDRITQQITHGKQMLDEIQVKIEKYHALMEDAALEVERCNEEINYVLSHPITRTYTDENGNEYTVEEIDEAALAAAQRARDQAQELYDHYRNKHERATDVKYEVNTTVSRFEQIKNGINAVAQSIQSDIFEIKKYINAIETEINYNLTTMQGTLDSMGVYLTSKPIYIPAGSTYSDYSVQNASWVHSYSSAGGGKVDLGEVAATTMSKSSTSYDSVVDAEELSKKYFNKLSKKDVKRLSDAEKKQLKIYLDDNNHDPSYKHAYEQINGYLRHGYDISDSMMQTMNSITEILSKHTLQRDSILYRGVDVQGAAKIFGKFEGRSIYEINDMFQGQLFIEKGFSSTSVKIDDAFKYCNNKGIMFKIYAPAGAEGIFTNDLSGYSSLEHEVLLQRGSVYRIDRIRDMRDYYEMRVTLLGRVQ